MINIDNITVDPEPILRKKAEKVTFPLSKEDETLINEMITYVIDSKDETLVEKNRLIPAVGIAAPQVGVSKQMCVIHVEIEGNIHQYALINPLILSKSRKQAALSGGEGCLSIRDEHPGYVYRSYSIKVKAYDYFQKEVVTFEAEGYLAIVIQHEIDHLNGILFYDRINSKNPWYEKENAIII